MLLTWFWRLTVRKLLPRLRSMPVNPRAVRACTPVLSIERLEDRELLSGVTFFDGTFNNSNWTGQKIPYNTHNGLNDYSAAVSSFTSGQVATGGDPGAYQGMTKNWTGPGGILVGELNKNAVYDPAKSGPISNINFSMNDIAFQDAGLGADFTFLLVQNGAFYEAGFQNAFQGQPWQPFALQNLTAADFSLIPGSPGSSSAPPHPDFSATGAPIQFGYRSGNGVNDASTEATSSGVDNWSVTINSTATNITPSLNWDTSQGGVDLSYQVNGGAVPKDTQVALYWSPTQTYDPSTATLIPGTSQTISAGTPAGTYGPFNVSAATLGPPPPGAKYLLAVTDPNNVLGNFSQSQNVASLQLLDIVMNSVKTADSKSVTFNYSVSGGSVGAPFDVAIYRADTSQFNPNDPNFTSDYQQVATTTIPTDQATAGTNNTITVPISGGLPPEPSHPYVLAVADPSGTIPESDSSSNSNNTASFQIYTIAFVVPGFGYTATESPPSWATNMVTALKDTAHYDYATPFMWNSGTYFNSKSWDPVYFTQAENGLAQEVKSVASSYPANSVVDVNLIGHSRGADVVAGASQLLANTTAPQLQDGYLEVTLLDPHPANNMYSTNQSLNPKPLNIPGISNRIIKRYQDAQNESKDPPIVIPANVNYVSEYYQHTPYNETPFGFERGLNLWGLPPNQILIDSPETVFTNKTLLLPPIGHSEVHDWYTQNIVPLLFNGPA